MGIWSRTGGVPRGAGRLVRRLTHAQGAGQTGLGKLIELHAVNSTGDMLIAVSLAGTLFFNLDVNQARGQLALYLVVTMAPFALIAPLIGPALDHMRSARRFTIAGTMALRGILCWAMAGAVTHDDSVTLLPAAFAALVLSKAFGISRIALVPRVLPENLSLVTANARSSFTGLIAASIVAPSAVALSAAIGDSGPAWVLRIGTVVFVFGMVLGLRLPKHADTPDDEMGSAPDEGGEEGGLGADVPPGSDDTKPSRAPGTTRRWRTLHRVGPIVGEAIRANAVLRGFSGFLILYLAFLLREHRFDPVSQNVALGLLAAAAGLGSLAGTGIGALTKARAPELFMFGTLAFVTLTAAVCATFFGIWAALAVVFVGGIGQSLGKMSMDAVVQREIGEEIRSSTFAVSEAIHQLVWVVGGLTGLGMSIVAPDGGLALSLMAGVLGLSFAVLVYHRVRKGDTAPPGREAPNPVPN